MEFLNYYWIFIKNFFEVVAILICLICKEKLEWSKEVETLFEALKIVFIFIIIIYYINYFKVFFLEIDTSNFAIDIILLQIEVDDKFHLIFFYSNFFFLIEINYKIHNKELLAIMDLYQEWHQYLKGTFILIIMYIYHNNLKYFMWAYILNHYYAC